MNLEHLQTILGWCSIINAGLLILWFMGFALMHDWIFQLHSHWFNLSLERFDAIHYAGMAFLKMIVVVFNIVPYIAICLANT